MNLVLGHCWAEDSVFPGSFRPDGVGGLAGGNLQDVIASCLEQVASPHFLFEAPKMPDRADYLARTLLTRRRRLETVLAEDDAGTGPPADLRRQDLVVKILAVEAGVTDSALVRRICLAMPPFHGGRDDTEWELREFADFLRGSLVFD